MFLGPDFYQQDNPLLNASQLNYYANQSYFSYLGEYALVMWNVWNKYPADQYFAKFPKFTIPAIMMNGDLDANTPIQQAFAASMVTGVPMLQFPGT